MEKGKEITISTRLTDYVPFLHEISISLIKTKLNIAFPLAGPIINEFLFELNGRIKQKRVNDFVEMLSKKVDIVQEEKVSREYLNSEEFHDLTQKIFESASKADTETKRRALANIYLNAMYHQDSNLDQNMMFTDFVNSLKTGQIYILHCINTKTNELKEIGTYDKYYAKFQELYPNKISDKYEFKYYNFELESKSLISMGGGLENFDSTSSIQAWDDHKDASIVLTTIGQKFLWYLTN